MFSVEFFEDCFSSFLVLPSDHFIGNDDSFLEAVQKAVAYSENQFLVTFGIEPVRAETAYGYIRKGKSKGDDVCLVEEFVEKPPRELAQKYLDSGSYLWNSGMFVCKASTMLKELSKFTPQVVENCEICLRKSVIDLDFIRIDKASFSQCPDISIDVAVLEKTQKAYVLPLDCGWDDIGNWESLWNITEKDNNGNVLEGKVFLEEVKNSYLKSSGRLIVGLDISDLIIIETFDAILVAKRGSSQKVKNVVEILKKKKYDEATIHKKIFRVWCL